MIPRSSQSSERTAEHVIKAITAAASRADAALAASGKDFMKEELDAMRKELAAAVAASSSSSSSSISSSLSTDQDKKAFPVDDELIGLLEEREKLKDLLKPGGVVASPPAPSSSSSSSSSSSFSFSSVTEQATAAPGTASKDDSIMAEAKATAQRWQEKMTTKRRTTLEMDSSLFLPHVTAGSTLKGSGQEGKSDAEALARLKKERDFLLQRLAEEEARGDRILKIKQACEAERARRMREEVDAEMSGCVILLLL